VSDTLRMVTAVAAQALGIDEHVGTLTPGRWADLLVVQGNPLERIRDIHHVRAVYQSGRLAHSPGAAIQ
jgi:imidazolonepropionase-like amidohydrolase